MIFTGRAARALTVFVCLWPAAAAADSEIDDLKAQAQKLMERIAQQEKELSDLKAQQAALLEKLEQKPGPPATAPERYQPESAAKSAAVSEGGHWFADHVRVGGYGSLRFETNDVGGGQFIPSGSANGFTFRRFVLTTDANITNRLRVHTETEFERLFNIETEKSASRTAGGVQLTHTVEGNSGGEISIEQVWGQYNFAESHGLRAGIVLPPLGRFNILHDDDYWDLPRRTLVDRDAPIIPVKAAWRDLGAGLVGSFNAGKSGKLDYQFYVLSGATLDFNLEAVAQTRNPRRSKMAFEGEFELTSGIFDGTQSARAVAWRTAYSPSLSGEFALSGYHGRYTPTWLGAGEPVNSLGFDYKWRKRGFELEGEAIYTSLGRTRRVIDAFANSVFNSSVETSGSETRQLESEIEFELTSLARTRYGFWNDFKYHWRPAWLKKSFFGRPFEDPQLIPILRYERVWLNRNLEEVSVSAGQVTDLETSDLQQDRVSLGLTYRPVRNFGLQLAYEHNRRINGETLIFPRVEAGSSNGFLAGLIFSF